MTGPAPALEAPPAALGLHPRQRLTGGHRNAVWLCDGPDGAVVAKCTRRTEQQLRWLAPLHSAARAAGFHLPSLRPDSSGQLLQQGWTVEAWVEGPAPPTDMQALAPRIRAFHTSCPPLPQRPGFARLSDLLTQSTSGDVDLTALPADILRRLRRTWAAVADTPAQAIHGDLGPANLILTANGPCLLDWDEARVDLSFLDFIHAADQTSAAKAAHLAWEIASCWQAEPEHAQSLLARFCLPGNTGR
ncbi:MAG: phosphotransferase [Paracoccaceae bacterium]